MLNHDSPTGTVQKRTRRGATSLVLMCAVLTVAWVATPGCVNVTLIGEDSAPDSARANIAIEAVLDALHAAAAHADEEVYFDLYAPEAIFLGTDATERWTLDEFHDFARPYFQRDSAWVYQPIERHITLSPGGGVAWFDERLHNDRFGQCRGSGALRLIDGEWKITQYNLTIPIPNDLADDVVSLIRAGKAD